MLSEKNNIFKKTLVCIFGLAVIFCFVAGICFYSASGAEFGGVSYDEFYYLDETLEIQEGKFTADGNEYVADFYTVYPDGSKNVSRNLLLDQQGEYTVKYFYTADGSTYSAEESFFVNQPLYEVVGSGSADFVSYEFSDTHEVVSGIRASLQDMDELKFNKKIDLNGKTKDDILISLNILAQDKGEFDFKTLRFRFTDAYNTSNYVDIVAYASEGTHDSAYYSSYWNAGAYNQQLTGYEYLTGQLFVASVYGKNINASFRSMPYNNRSLKDDVFTVSFDYEEKSVYGSYLDGRDPFIIDLDNSSYFSNLWNGFTTGEVYMSIFCEKLVKSHADILITSFAGGEKLNKNFIFDDVDPVIDIDYDGYSENNIPEGKLNEKYKIFDYEASDNIGIAQVKTNVIYGNKININLKDGYFIPQYSGIYTVIYTATDLHGNVTTEKYNVFVGTTEKSLTLQLDDSKVTGKCGEAVSVKDFVFSGGYGEPKAEITVTGENGFSQAVSITDKQFVPLQSGVYKVNVTVKDYVGQSLTKSYNLEVAPNNKPIFLDDVDNLLPSYFMAGYDYTLPDLKANDFSSGEAVSIDAAVSVNNGEYADGLFRPANDGSVTITYSATCNGISDKREYTRPVINIFENGSMNVSKLFVLDSGVTGGFGTGGYAVYTMEDDAGMTFINSVLAKPFYLSLNFEADKTNFSSVSVYLIDSEDTDAVIKFNVRKASSGAILSINDGKAINVSQNFNGDQSKDFIFSYDDRSGYFTFDKLSYLIATYTNGKEFNGFESGFVNIRVELEGVTGPSQIIVKNVNGQIMLEDVDDDYLAPQIAVLGELTGVYNIGAEVTVPPVVVKDVISPSLGECTVKVLSPSEEVVVSTDGMSLNNLPLGEYTFKLTEYGTYEVIYTLKDSAGNSITKKFMLTVFDEKAPEITVDSAEKLNAKVGDTHKIAGYSVKDDISSEDKIIVRIFVIGPDGKIDNAASEIIFAEKGDYRICYYAMDETGNTAMRYYTVYVR